MPEIPGAGNTPAAPPLTPETAAAAYRAAGLEPPPADVLEGIAALPPSEPVRQGPLLQPLAPEQMREVDAVPPTPAGESGITIGRRFYPADRSRPSRPLPILPQPGEMIGSAWRALKAVGGDVARGIVEAPAQVVGGAIDGLNAALQLIDRGGDALATATGVGTPSPDTAQLPDPIADPQTVTGRLVHGVAQFLTGFGVAGRAVRGVAPRLAAAAPTVVRAAGQGFVADAAFFTAQDNALAALLEAAPALRNPVTEYLAGDENDSELEGRFKNALQGLGFGAMTDAFTAAVRSLRIARRERSPAERGAALGRAGETVPAPAGEMNLLGDPAAPLVGQSPDAAKLSAAAAETAGVEPGTVLRGTPPPGEVFINWARIDAPEDVQAAIQATADAMKPMIDDAARGVRSFETTVTAAGDIDAWNVLVNRRSGQPLNAEQSLAARELWAQSGTKLQEVATLAAANPSPENLFQFRRMLAVHHAIQKEVLGARAETARALGSWRIQAGSGLSRMRDIEDTLNRFGGVEVSQEMARAVVAAGSVGGNGAVSRFVEKSLYATGRDAIQEYWINAILSGPKTHIVNVLSNASVIGLTVLERAAASRLGRVLGGDDVVEVGEASALAHGARMGFMDALRNAGRTLRTGETGFGVGKVEVPPGRNISSTAWNMRSDSFLGRAVDTLGAVVNLPGRLLQTEDEFFKTIGYRMSLHSQAYRQVSQEVREGRLEPAAAKDRMAELVANPSDTMDLEAAAAAAYQTFTTPPGRFVRKLDALRSEYPMLRFILPFVRTPANIFKFVAERTPLAPLTARYRASVAKGGAEADLARSRIALGTTTMLVGLDLALNERISGSGPSSPAERANLQRQGWQPYSIKIGDRWYAYNRLDPAGAFLGYAADLGEVLANNDGMDGDDGVEFERAMSAAVFAVAENVTSKSYMDGLADIVATVSDPERFAASWTKRFVGSFVPTIFRETARAVDPVQRETAGIIDELRNRVPGLSSGLAPRRDLWGREVSFESGLGRTFDALSPIYSRSARSEPIDRAMTEDGVFVGMPSKVFTIDGERVSLSTRPEIYSRYLELQGNTPASRLGERLAGTYGDLTLLQALNALVEGDLPDRELAAEYAAAPDPDERNKVIDKVVGAYRRQAREMVLGEFPWVGERATQLAAERAADAATRPAPVE